MNELGWNYPALSGEAVVSGEDLGESFASIAARRKVDGYGLVKLPGSVEASPLDQYLSSLTEAELDSFSSDLGGTSSEDGSVVGSLGCRQRAEEVVYKDLPAHQPAYADLTAQFENDLTGDPRFQELISEWSRCMSERGYAIAAPNEVSRVLGESVLMLTDQEITDRYAELKDAEIRMAVADSECYEQHVLSQRASIEAEILDRYVSEGRLSADLWPLA